MIHKRQVARLHFVQLIDTRCQGIRIAEEFSTKEFCNP
jgi:hypothetical protein